MVLCKLKVAKKGLHAETLRFRTDERGRKTGILLIQTSTQRAWAVSSAQDTVHIANVLASLGDPTKFNQMYPNAPGDVMLFAMGDGNHSLAAAKLCWEVFIMMKFCIG